MLLRWIGSVVVGLLLIFTWQTSGKPTIRTADDSDDGNASYRTGILTEPMSFIRTYPSDESNDLIPRDTNFEAAITKVTRKITVSSNQWIAIGSTADPRSVSRVSVALATQGAAETLRTRTHEHRRARSSPSTRRINCEDSSTRSNSIAPFCVDVRQGSSISMVSVSRNPPDTRRTFLVPYCIGKTPGARPITAHCMAYNDAVVVYGEQTEPTANDTAVQDGLEFAQTIVQILTQTAIPEVGRVLGAVEDVDSDGRLTVLMTDRLASFPAGPTPLRGFVRSCDLLPTDNDPSSNYADLIYLNSKELADQGLTALLVHEVAHLATFSRRRERGQPLQNTEWIDEGIAHAMEVMVTNDWSNLDTRIRAFRKNSNSTSLLSDRNPHNWRDPASRGAMALFFHHLVQTRSPSILFQIATSPGSGTTACEHACDLPFAQLYREWVEADIQSLAKPTQHTTTDSLEQDWNPQNGALEFDLRGFASRAIRISTPETIAGQDAQSSFDIEITAPEAAKVFVIESAD